MTDEPRVDLRPFPFVDAGDDAAPVTKLVDMIFVRVMRELAPGRLAATRDEGPNDDVTAWRFTPAAGGPPVVITPPRKIFRTMLARIGHHFMEDQLYGGAIKRLLVHESAAVVATFRMSNAGAGGFWVEIDFEAPSPWP